MYVIIAILKEIFGLVSLLNSLVDLEIYEPCDLTLSISFSCSESGYGMNEKKPPS